MSNEKFTPGKWEIEERQAHFKSFELYGFDIHTQSKRICVSQTDDPANIPQMQANAHLIAAAPEMYALLSVILSPTAMMSQQFRDTGLRTAIENVLKKARGEE